MQILLLAGAAALVVLVSYALHSIFVYTRLIGNIFLSLVYRPPYEAGPVARGEKISVLDSSEREIEVLFHKTPNARRTVVFCHESGSSKESWEKYGYFLPSMDCNVISLDLAGNENESGTLSQWPKEQNVARVVTVVRWAKTTCPGTKLILFGVSNGADVAFASAFAEPAAAGVITDGLFSMKEIFRGYIRKWAPVLVKPNFFGDRLPEWIVSTFARLGFWHCQRLSRTRFVDVELLLRKKHMPVLMIHGDADEYVPADHRGYLQKFSTGGLLQSWVVAGAGHNQAVTVDPDAYRKRVGEFLESL